MSGVNSKAQLTVEVVTREVVATLKDRIRLQNPHIKKSFLLRELGQQLDKHLVNAAAIVDKLERDGWDVRMNGNFIHAQHHDIKELDQAVFRVKAIGIDPKHVFIHATENNWFVSDEIMQAIDGLA